MLELVSFARSFPKGSFSNESVDYGMEINFARLNDRLVDECAQPLKVTVTSTSSTVLSTSPVM